MKDSNLKVSKYIRSSKMAKRETATLEELYGQFLESGDKLKKSMIDLFKRI